MKEVINKNKCCGCHACYNICLKNAISMVEDELGFKYPVIDQKKCIDCGMCKNVCPALNSKEEEKDVKAYAAYNKNIDERINSSSGGIFILLAKEIIKRKGVVFGASFDKDFNVRHTYVEKEKDLKQFMGSKYTQSSIGDSYKKVKEFLDKNRYVLFSGTPCQIEGLKSYLKKDYDKLYTQDIVCHGVPSPKAWQKYLEYQKEKNNDSIKEVSFRSKDNGWASYKMNIKFNNKEYKVDHSKDIYMKSFLSNICLRDSCYNCSFKKKYRNSDITLADYWGINKVHPEMDDKKGTSLVVVNSKKGKELFELIKNDIIYIETDLDIAIKNNASMIVSSNRPNNREEYINDIDKMNMEKLTKKYVPKPGVIKRGISFGKRCVERIIR